MSDTFLMLGALSAFLLTANCAKFSLYMYIRDQWIEKTHFHPHTTEQVLKEVEKRVASSVSGGNQPVVVFDLDSTLFDVSRRSYEILQEWISSPEAQQFTETVERLSKLKPEEMRYSLQDVWETRKIPVEGEPFATHFKHARNFWRRRFFAHSHLVHDEPTAGSVAFVKTLYDAGAFIVYLTGRDVPLMSFGTFDQLKLHGLPIEEPKTRLILKPKRHIDDLEFKAGVAKLVKEWGEVIASFENEPKNLVAMAEVFSPTTMNVFIKTVSSDHPAPAGKNIYRIEDFA